MYPAAIDDYDSPSTIADAIAAKLRLGEGGMFLAGGMSVMQAIKARLLRPTGIVDLNGVDELRGISREDGAISVGGMTRYREIAASLLLLGGLQALQDAASHVGDRQVRNRGTIGGSMCWNYVSACTPPVVLALAGEIELASSGGRRRVAAADFLKGPLETDRHEDEVLVAVRFRSGPRTGSAYKKWGLVTDSLPVVGVAARVDLDPQGAVETATIMLAGMQSGPVRFPAAEVGLVGLRSTDLPAIRQMLERAASTVATHTDLWASGDYRRVLIASIGTEVLAQALARAAVPGGSDATLA